MESVGNYEGTDGLRIGDLPELRIAPPGGEAEVNVTFARVPTMVVVRAELGKAGHQYFSFSRLKHAGTSLDTLNRG